jgi:hypothetical protein
MSAVSQGMETSRSQEFASAAYPSHTSHGEPHPPLDHHVGCTPEIGDLVLEQATREREDPMDYPEHVLRIRADPRGEHECEGGNGGNTKLDQVQEPTQGSVKVKPVEISQQCRASSTPHPPFRPVEVDAFPEEVAPDGRGVVQSHLLEGQSQREGDAGSNVLPALEEDDCP